MPNQGRRMIENAVPRLIGESVKEYQFRVSDETGIGHASIVQCWKGNYWSRDTEMKLIEVAKNADTIPAQLRKVVVELEDAANRAAMAGEDGAMCDALRLLADQVRNMDREFGHLHEGPLVKLAIAFVMSMSTFFWLIPEAHAMVCW